MLRAELQWLALNSNVFAAIKTRTGGSIFACARFGSVPCHCTCFRPNRRSSRYLRASGSSWTASCPQRGRN
jgi:hypothetical protein